MAEEVIIQVITEEAGAVIVGDNSTNIDVIEAAPINIDSTSPVQQVTVTQDVVSVQIASVVTTGGSTNISHIEMDLLLKPGSNARYKTFTYTGDKITSQQVYADNTMATQLYDITYSYSGDSLASVQVVRIADSFSYTKTFTYDVNNNLTATNYE